MITPYNDYTQTNRIDLNTEKGKLAKRILRKHTSHPDNIRKMLKNGNTGKVRTYLSKAVEGNVKKIIILINELKQEAKERDDMLKKISTTADFSQVHTNTTSNSVTDNIWNEVMETLQKTEKDHKQTLLILADEIYKIGGIKNKVQRSNAIIANLDKEVRPKTMAELIKKRNLKVKLQDLQTRARDIQKLNEAVQQNDEILEKLYEILKPLAKKHNIKINTEDKEKFSNNYKSIFKNENKN